MYKVSPLGRLPCCADSPLGVVWRTKVLTHPIAIVNPVPVPDEPLLERFEYLNQDSQRLITTRRTDNPAGRYDLAAPLAYPQIRSWLVAPRTVVAAMGAGSRWGNRCRTMVRGRKSRPRRCFPHPCHGATPALRPVGQWPNP